MENKGKLILTFQYSLSWTEKIPHPLLTPISLRFIVMFSHLGLGLLTGFLIHQLYDCTRVYYSSIIFFQFFTISNNPFPNYLNPCKVPSHIIKPLSFLCSPWFIRIRFTVCNSLQNMFIFFLSTCHRHSILYFISLFINFFFALWSCLIHSLFF